jgi:hypothetical protein
MHFPLYECSRILACEISDMINGATELGKLLRQLQRAETVEQPSSCQGESGHGSMDGGISRVASTHSDHSMDLPKLQSQMLDIGEEIAVRREGEMMGEMSLITGQRRTATVVASTDCTMISLDHGAIRPLLVSKPELAQDLAELVHSRLAGKPFTSGVTLRLHQAMSCGSFWFACMGGAEMSKHVGARREFLIIGMACMSPCFSCVFACIFSHVQAFVGALSDCHMLWEGYIVHTQVT